MWPVSQALLRTIRGPHRVTARLEYRNGDGEWRGLSVVDGTATADRTSQVRWSLDATVHAPPEDLSPYASMLRAYRGVHVAGQVEWVPLGLYRMSSMNHAAASGTVKLSASSREAIIADAGFLVPRTARGDAESAITDLIREVIPDAYIDYRAAPGSVDTIIEDQDRWKLIAGSRDDASIANALGAEVFCDNIGRFVVAPIPTLDRAPMWEAGEGALVSEKTSRSRDGVYNVVVATGANLGEDEQAGPGYAWDDDPFSPTYAGADLHDVSSAGPFGRVIKFYSSSALKTTADCERAARGQLADSLGLHQQVSFTSLINPALVPGDVVRVSPPGLRSSDHVIDRIAIPLAGGASVDVTTRTSRRA